MANASTFFKDLATSAGVSPETNEALKALIANDALAGIEIDTVLAGVIKTNLMNVEAAKNNPALSKHFKYVHLNGVDGVLGSVASDLLSDAEIEALKSEPETIKKLQKLKEAFLATYEKKGTKKDKDAAEQEREKLMTELADLKASIPTIEKAAQDKYNTILSDRDMDALLLKYEYGVDLPKDVIVRTGKSLITDKIKSLGYALKYNPEEPIDKFSLHTADGLKAYTKDNQPVTLVSLSDQVLAENKLLKVSGGSSTQTQTHTNTSTMQTGVPNSKLEAIYAEMDQQVNTLQKQ